MDAAHQPPDAAETDVKAITVEHLIDECQDGNKAACAELDRRGVEPPMLEPDYTDLPIAERDERTALVMPSSVADDLVHRAGLMRGRRGVSSRQRKLADALWSALTRVEVVDLHHVRVRCTESALAFIGEQCPDLARLWPTVFGAGAPKTARKFIRASRAHWAEANDIGQNRPTPEEFILTQDEPQIELLVRYHDLANETPAQVTVFDESWQAFTLWRDLWDALAQAADASGGMAGDFTCSPDDLEAILTRLGFEDATPTSQPS